MKKTNDAMLYWTKFRVDWRTICWASGTSAYPHEKVTTQFRLLEIVLTLKTWLFFILSHYQLCKGSRQFRCPFVQVTEMLITSPVSRNMPYVFPLCRNFLKNVIHDPQLPFIPLKLLWNHLNSEKSTRKGDSRLNSIQYRKCFTVSPVWSWISP